ncbi:hypothetical protein [Caballeronia calidae]|nr:hypothetical protein [Caballeronia calidae]
MLGLATIVIDGGRRMPVDRMTQRTPSRIGEILEGVHIHPRYLPTKRI